MELDDEPVSEELLRISLTRFEILNLIITAYSFITAPIIDRIKNQICINNDIVFMERIIEILRENSEIRHMRFYDPYNNLYMEIEDDIRHMITLGYVRKITVEDDKLPTIIIGHKSEYHDIYKNFYEKNELVAREIRRAIVQLLTKDIVKNLPYDTTSEDMKYVISRANSFPVFNMDDALKMMKRDEALHIVKSQ